MVYSELHITRHFHNWLDIIINDKYFMTVNLWWICNW